MKASSAILGAILVVLLCAKPAAQAMPPLSRTLTGVVERMDHDLGIIAVLPDGEKVPRLFRWTPKRAKFVRDAAFTSPKALREGESVEVRYRAPLFGERFATRIFWHTGTRRSLPETTQKTKTTKRK